MGGFNSWVNGIFSSFCYHLSYCRMANQVISVAETRFSAFALQTANTKIAGAASSETAPSLSPYTPIPLPLSFHKTPLVPLPALPHTARLAGCQYLPGCPCSNLWRKLLVLQD